MSKLSHLDNHGAARMVDVSGKEVTTRQACAEAIIQMSPQAYAAAIAGTGPKGDVLAAARIAGIMAIKRTSDLIPLCHPLAISNASVAFEPLAEQHALRILASVKINGQTGVEMEALTGASIAALTVYDMVKAIDKACEIGSIRLLEKTGGKSGAYAVPEVRAHHRSSRYRSAPGSVADAPVPRRERPQPAEQSESDAGRQALRGFMTKHHLRASQWAKDAGVPVAQIYGFLTGRARTIPLESLSKLADVAGVAHHELLGTRR